ncbi:MAG: hypothetical protein BroJett024_41120 [Alphaproteobacteria bacterium]|nr:MAG: hypothetical protein BroJett024_41120 [Alphaproteobacteria bacterium]
MAKGYWIARVNVTDEAAYRGYIETNGAAFEKYGGRFLVRGGAFVCPEGGTEPRNVVVEFPDYATALACYHSPEYQHARSFRQGAADFNILIIEGYDGPQPS